MTFANIRRKGEMTFKVTQGYRCLRDHMNSY